MSEENQREGESISMSCSGAAWREWFDRLGSTATSEVINATANLVIVERHIHAHSRRDSTPLTQSARSTLLRIAAAMARCDGFISPYERDNLKTTPKAILRHAERQEEMLKDWAHELGEIARGRG